MKRKNEIENGDELIPVKKSDLFNIQLAIYALDSFTTISLEGSWSDFGHVLHPLVCKLEMAMGNYWVE